MRLAHALAVALLLVDEVSAWSWSAGDSGIARTREELDERAELAIATDPASLDPSTLDLSPQEQRALFSALHLLPSSSSNRPDCFRSVASELRARCTSSSSEGRGEKSVVGEEDRVDAAIFLTLCDLTSAGISPPSECAAYDPRLVGARSHWWDQERASGHANDKSSMRSRCIESLSRSPQFWSSYSGYVREATQLCFALQRSRDVDRAHQIYVNATLEKVALLQHLKSNERALEDRLSDLSALSSRLSDLHEEMFASDHVASEIREVLQSVWVSAEQSLWAETENGLRPILEKHYDLLVAREQASLTRILEKQESEVSAWVTRTLDGLMQGREWTKLSEGLLGMGKSLDVLDLQSGHLASSLSQSHSLVSRTNDLSSRSLLDLTSLAQTVANLSDVLEAQVILANRTHHLLECQERRLTLSGSSWLGWVAGIAWRMLGGGLLASWAGGTGGSAIAFSHTHGSPSLIERLLETWLTSRALGFAASMAWSLFTSMAGGLLTLAGSWTAWSIKHAARCALSHSFVRAQARDEEAILGPANVVAPVLAAPIRIKPSPKTPVMPVQSHKSNFQPRNILAELEAALDRLAAKPLAPGDRSRRARSSPLP